MDKNPRNGDGQEPTQTPKETVDRLEQKKHEASGGANWKRIHDQQEEVTEESGRSR